MENLCLTQNISFWLFYHTKTISAGMEVSKISRGKMCDMTCLNKNILWQIYCELLQTDSYKGQANEDNNTFVLHLSYGISTAHFKIFSWMKSTLEQLHKMQRNAQCKIHLKRSKHNNLHLVIASFSLLGTDDVHGKANW